MEDSFVASRALAGRKEPLLFEPVAEQHLENFLERQVLGYRLELGPRVKRLVNS